MFLKTPNCYINLKNVSNINIIEGKNRIVFNMNYNIENTSVKHISDYVYWNAGNEEEFKQNITKLEENLYLKGNFIPKINNGYININEISSIKFGDKKRRIIFNLSHSVAHIDANSRKIVTSEFVFVDCADKTEYTRYKSYIKQILGE